LVLNSPAIYGYGTANDAASLTVDKLVWNGTRAFIQEGDGTYTFISAPPGATLPGGPGTGLGSFTVNAREIVLGYPQNLSPYPDGLTRFDRLMLGFASVNLNASERIVGNRMGGLSVFAQGPSPDAGYKADAYAGTGGNLILATPLLTGEAGSILDLRAGGALTVMAPAGTAAVNAMGAALGAQISLTAGGGIAVDTTVFLPSGRLVMTAAGDITLGDRARLDLSGQAVRFFDVTKYTWGGDLVLESARGNIIQSTGAIIDVSAGHNDAGTLTLTATGDGAGLTALGGILRGEGGAGYKGGSIDLRVQRIGGDPAALTRDFAALNAAFNAAGFSESRSFALKQGSLVIGNEVKAHRVSVSVDGGSLAVDGTIDASGQRVGSIRLAARDDLTVAGALDAHGSVLRIDSNGVAIAAANTAEVELSSRNGLLTLAPNAVIDLRSADSMARGKLTLNAPRTGTNGPSATGAGAPINATGGDIAIMAGGPLAIRGARQIVLNGYTSYTNAPYQNGDVTTRTQIVTQGFLDLIDQDSTMFINAALANTGLQGRLAGLTAYGDAFHLRPGVEITSATSGGNLTVAGDLDLAGYRYGPHADRNTASATYGAGEPIAFTLRAGGNLIINGSISDGFGPANPGVPAVYTGLIASGTDPATHIGDIYQSYAVDGVGSYYGNDHSAIYLTEAWTIPNDGFYNWLWALVDDQYNYYFPGSTIPAGTKFSAGNFAIETGVAAPGIAIGFVPAVPAIPATAAPAPALAPGSRSASIRLVAGADLGAADTRALLARSVLGGVGNMTLSDDHTYDVRDWSGVVHVPIASSIRTGAGDLDLLAGGDIAESSIYNISTRGWRDAAPADLYVQAQGTLSGWSYGSVSGSPDNWVNRGSLAYDDGFTGFGALGGGNVMLRTGKDAGALTPVVAGYKTSYYRNTALVVAADGGGDVTLDIGGRLNPNIIRGEGYGGDDENGILSNLRGNLTVNAGGIGYVPLRYGQNEINDPRSPDPGRAMLMQRMPRGGVIVTPGDGRIVLRTRGDLVLAGVSKAKAGGEWRSTTAIELISAGGNLVPYNTQDPNLKAIDLYGALSLPAIFSAMAASGSIYYSGQSPDTKTTLHLAPSPHGQLELLAQDSIYGAAGRASISGPQYQPARLALSGADTDPALFGDPAQLHDADSNPIRIYAATGDLVNVVLGEILEYQPVYQGPITTLYFATKAAGIRAGRDIVNFGRGPQQYDVTKIEPGLIVNTGATDVSVIAAGRNMYHTNVRIAGPGTLEVTAGGNVYQGDKGNITSIGPLAADDNRPGASIVMMAGTGAAGANYTALKAYLDPANLAVSGVPLADQPGKVAKTYEQELAAWLRQRYGFEGSLDAARAYFDQLAPEQQAIFLRQVYFAELRAGGREYNDPASSRYRSYLRGRSAIASLFSDTDADGRSISRAGDITMFGGSGVRTLVGGDIQILAPEGKLGVGVEGLVPPASSGVVTQGAGDIGLYAKGSILLGLSRVMTTYGGDILAWSAEGDINAGRGAKTTQVYTPPRRMLDRYGNVKLSPQAPATGAGIATLSPIAGIPSGDVDLYAPLGTIDAGEAGIRSSGNVNLAALHVVNAGNIEVGGVARGIPTVQAPNVGALTSASGVAGAAAKTAEAPMSRDAEARPSIIMVEVVGYGGGEGGDTPAKKPAEDNRQSGVLPAYDPKSPVRILGVGPLTDQEKAAADEDIRQHL